MGLDIYLEGKKHFFKNSSNNEEEEGFIIKEKIYELGYWRKQYGLHEYICNRFANPDHQEIGAMQLYLSSQHITQIISDLNQALVNNKWPVPKSKSAASIYDIFGPAQYLEYLEIFTRALFWVQVKEDHAYRTVVYRASW